MQESGAVLIKRYGFDAEKHAAYIQRLTATLGRQPAAAGDRLSWAQPAHAAAAMHYRSEADPQAQELASLIVQKGPQAALAEISGLDANSEVVSSVVSAYHAMA